MFAKTATTGQICNLILRYSHTAEYMSVQADIANTQAQHVREAVNKIRLSKKDLRRLGKGNVAVVMTGENILKEIQVREKINKEKAAKKQFHTRKSAQRAVVVTPVKPRVRFQLEETPTRLLRSTTSTIPRPNYYLPPLAEVIEDDSDAESFTTTFSADFSEDGYHPHTTSHPGPNVISSTPVTLLTMRLRSRKS